MSDRHPPNPNDFQSAKSVAGGAAHPRRTNEENGHTSSRSMSPHQDSLLNLLFVGQSIPSIHFGRHQQRELSRHARGAGNSRDFAGVRHRSHSDPPPGLFSLLYPGDAIGEDANDLSDESASYRIASPIWHRRQRRRGSSGTYRDSLLDTLDGALRLLETSCIESTSDGHPASQAASHRAIVQGGFSGSPNTSDWLPPLSEASESSRYSMASGAVNLTPISTEEFQRQHGRESTSAVSLAPCADSAEEPGSIAEPPQSHEGPRSTP
jgi:hypothetical protein